MHLKQLHMVFLFNDPTGPLYMILCITLVIVVPILPAWLLYVIAPKEKFLATGSFSGFQINATGAAAIYIVLIALIYPKTDSILKTIDDNDRYKLTQQISDLESQNEALISKAPWRVQCTLTLFDENKAEIGRDEYYTSLNPKGIQEFPNPVVTDASSKTITFYVDNSAMQADSTNCNLIFTNGNYGSANIPIIKSKAKGKEIYLTTSLWRTSNNAGLGKSTPNLPQRYDSAQGLKTLPSVR